MESEWLLIGGKVIAKVLIQYDLSAPCNIPSISHERVASSLSSFNWVRPLRTCTAVKKLVSLQIELSSITFCGVSPGHRRGNGNKLANKRTPADNFHTHTHTLTPHTCVCSKKRWVKVWKHFWFIKNLKSSKCFQTRARCLWNWSSFFIWTGNICNCIWIECATVRLCVCVSVCVPQFHLKSFKVPNEMMLRVLWACTEELNESSLPTTSA